MQGLPSMAGDLAHSFIVLIDLEYYKSSWGDHLLGSMQVRGKVQLRGKVSPGSAFQIIITTTYIL